MALFKVSKGSKSNLPTTLTEGYCWYTYDDSKFYIDHKDENGTLVRKALNAQDAETLGLHTADEFLLKTEALQTDWNQMDPTRPDYIKNKPKTGAIFSTSVSNNVFVLEQTGAIYEVNVTNETLILI